MMRGRWVAWLCVVVLVMTVGHTRAHLPPSGAELANVAVHVAVGVVP